jgi:hypothetical protein
MELVMNLIIKDTYKQEKDLRIGVILNLGWVHLRLELFHLDYLILQALLLVEQRLKQLKQEPICIMDRLDENII